MYVYGGGEPSESEVESHCNNHGRDDYTLNERIAFALWFDRGG